MPHAVCDLTSSLVNEPGTSRVNSSDQQVVAVRPPPPPAAAVAGGAAATAVVIRCCQWPWWCFAEGPSASR